MLPYGLSGFLIAAAVTTVVIAFGGRFSFIVAGPEGNTVTVLAAIASEIGLVLGTSGDSHQALMALTIVLLGATSLAGIGIYALGAARMGRWVRFVPYSVVAGFLAASGALMMKGAFGIITGVQFKLSELSHLNDSALLARLALGLAFAIVLRYTLARWKHPLALPALVIAGVLVFDAAIALLGVSVVEARELGWLFPQFAFKVAWPWGSPSSLLANSSLLVPQLGEVLALIVVGTFTILLNISSLEIVTESEADLDRELRFAGLANVVSAAFGGYFGCASTNRSMINRQSGAQSRAAALVLAIGCAAIILGGGRLFGFVAKPILGAILLYLGFDMLLNWAVQSRRRVSPSEYATILFIMVAIVGFGFVYGIVLGLLFGCIIFVWNYSRIDAIKHSLTGKQMRSRLARSPQQSALLDAKGELIRILTLQGYIFFGVADRLYQSISAGLSQPGAATAQFLALDFRLVTGVDAAAVATLGRLRSVVERVGARLVIAGMHGDTLRDWIGGGGGKNNVQLFSDLDPALEWCEDEILRGPDTAEQSGLTAWLTAELKDVRMALQVPTYMEAFEAKPGDIICQQGAQADSLYFIESGRIEVLFDPSDGRPPIRVSSSSQCTVVGDIGYYLGSPRTASVVAKDTTQLHRLDRDSFTRLEREAPETAIALHAMVTRILARRLISANELVSTLLR